MYKAGYLQYLYYLLFILYIISCIAVSHSAVINLETFMGSWTLCKYRACVIELAHSLAYRCHAFATVADFWNSTTEHACALNLNARRLGSNADTTGQRPANWVKDFLHAKPNLPLRKEGPKARESREVSFLRVLCRSCTRKQHRRPSYQQTGLDTYRIWAFKQSEVERLKTVACSLFRAVLFNVCNRPWRFCVLWEFANPGRKQVCCEIVL